MSTRGLSSASAQPLSECTLFLMSLEKQQTRNRKEAFVVAIGRDPSVLAHSDPDLVFTTNELEGLEEGKVISLVSLLHVEGSKAEGEIRDLLPFYDTNFLALLFFDPEHDHAENDPRQAAHKYAHIPDDWLAQAKELRDKVFSIIRERAGDKKVIINTYHNAYGMPKAWKDAGFVLQSPDSTIAYEFARKLDTRRLAERTQLSTGEMIPVRDGVVVPGSDVVRAARDLGGDVFIASDGDPYFAHNARFRVDHEAAPDFLPDTPYLVTRWHSESDGAQHSPNTQIVIGDHGVEYLGQLDQIIKENVKYGGNTYPSDSPPEVQEKLKDYTVALAWEMQRKGYRGIAGFDWVEARSGPDKGKVWLAEINPRKNRSTGLLAAILKHVHGHNRLGNLDYQAASGGRMSLDAVNRTFDQFAHMETYHPERTVFVPKDALQRLRDAGIALNEKPDPAGNPKLCVLNFPKPQTRIEPRLSANVIRLTSYGRTRTEAQDGARQIRKLLDEVLVPA